CASRTKTEGLTATVEPGMAVCPSPTATVSEAGAEPGGGGGVLVGSPPPPQAASRTRPKRATERRARMGGFHRGNLPHAQIARKSAQGTESRYPQAESRRPERHSSAILASVRWALRSPPLDPPPFRYTRNAELSRVSASTYDPVWTSS